MRKPNKGLLLTVLSIVLAVSAMHFLDWLNVQKMYSQSEYGDVWLKGILPAFGLFSLLFGLYEPRAPWRWPLLMMYVNYFSGFWIMTHWGQIPPFELILITILALPMILLGYLGAYLHNKAYAKN